MILLRKIFRKKKNFYHGPSQRSTQTVLPLEKQLTKIDPPTKAKIIRPSYLKWAIGLFVSVWRVAPILKRASAGFLLFILWVIAVDPGLLYTVRLLFGRNLVQPSETPLCSSFCGASIGLICSQFLREPKKDAIIIFKSFLLCFNLLILTIK